MSSVETWASIAIGAVIGFLGSLGLEMWKEASEKKELKNRIREELSLILEEVQSDYRKEAFQSRAHHTEAFLSLNRDLLKKLDARTFHIVQDAYTMVTNLMFPSNLLEANRKKYEETILSLKKAIASLE